MLSDVFFLREPDMRNARPDKDQVSRMEFLHRVAHNPLSGSFGDKAQFKFLVVVPDTFIDVVLKDANEERFIGIQLNLFQELLHANLILHKFN